MDWVSVLASLQARYGEKLVFCSTTVKSEYYPFTEACLFSFQNFQNTRIELLNYCRVLPTGWTRLRQHICAGLGYGLSMPRSVSAMNLKMSRIGGGCLIVSPSATR